MRRIFNRVAAGLIVAGLALSLAGTASAATLRWANDGDVNSMDPYARNETFLLTFLTNIYEPLVRRDRNLALEPALAVKWAQTSPTVWRFDLRPNVKWQDGSARLSQTAATQSVRAATDSLSGVVGVIGTPPSKSRPRIASTPASDSFAARSRIRR